MKLSREEFCTAINQPLMHHQGDYKDFVNGQDVKNALLVLYDAMTDQAGSESYPAHKRDIDWTLAFAQFFGTGSGLTAPLTPSAVAECVTKWAESAKKQADGERRAASVEGETESTSTRYQPPSPSALSPEEEEYRKARTETDACSNESLLHAHVFFERAAARKLIEGLEARICTLTEECARENARYREAQLWRHEVEEALPFIEPNMSVALHITELVFQRDAARAEVEKLKAQINADGVPHSEKACKKAMADEARMLLADSETKCKRRVTEARDSAIRECIEVVKRRLERNTFTVVSAQVAALEMLLEKRT